MSINIDDDNEIRVDLDAYYEMIASQEEIYLEETEEELRAFLISYRVSQHETAAKHCQKIVKTDNLSDEGD